MATYDVHNMLIYRITKNNAQYGDLGHKYLLILTKVSAAYACKKAFFLGTLLC